MYFELAAKKQQFRYNLVFDGKIRNGFTFDQVTRLLEEDFNLKQSHIKTLFSNKAKICDNEDYATVLKWHKKFFAAGIELKLERVKNAAIKADVTQPLPHTYMSKSPLTKRANAGSNSSIRVRPLKPQLAKQLLPGKQSTVSAAAHKNRRDKLSVNALENLFNQASVSLHTSPKLKSVLQSMGLICSCTMFYAGVIVGLIALLIWSVSDIATYFGSNIPGYAKVLIYLIPLIVMGPIIVSMFKPVITRHKSSSRQLLDEDQYKLLYKLVELVCAKLNQAPPSRIYVSNEATVKSSARFGLLGGLLGGGKEITIGMPLIASLRFNQVVGLLFFELSMVSSKAGMFSFWTLRTFNAGLSHRAWGSDKIDRFLERLGNAAQLNVSRLFFHVCNLYLAFSKMVVRLIYDVSYRMSNRVLHPLYQEALDNTCQFVGCDQLKQTIVELNSLHYSNTQIRAVNNTLMQKGQLLENLPTAIASYKQQHKSELDKILTFRMNKGNAKQFVDAAITPILLYEHKLSQFKQRQERIFSYSGSARIIVPHFEWLCSCVTSFSYVDLNIAEADYEMISYADALASSRIKRIAVRSLDTFFNGLFTGKRILNFSDKAAGKGEPLAHQELIDQIRWKSLDFKSTVALQQEWKQRRVLSKLGRDYIRVGIKINPEDYYLKRCEYNASAADVALAERKLEHAELAISDMDNLFYQRIQHCISAMSQNQQGKIMAKFITVKEMVALNLDLDQLEMNIEILDLLLNSEENRDESRKINEVIKRYKRSVQNNINSTLQSCKTVLNKYDHHTQTLYAAVQAKVGDEINQSSDFSEEQAVRYGRLLIRSVYNWYIAQLSQLTASCEALEKSKSIAPLRLL